MRAAAVLAALALAGCARLAAGASSKVALLDAEPGAAVGSVVVLDPKTEAERGQLATANTEAALGGGSVQARPLTTNYDSLLAAMPAPPRVFTLYFVEGTSALTPES